MKAAVFKTVLSFLLICITNGLDDLSEGDSCRSPKGIEGKCVRIKNCGASEKVIREQLRYNICGFIATVPLICCPKNDTGPNDARSCDPFTPRRPDMKIGKIAFHKCIEYQEQLKFPCILSNLTRRDACSDPPPVISSTGRQGIDASRGQFPHMALLGYSKELSKPDSAEWLCGGTIISDRFILTAGHCTEHSSLGSVAFARLGILKRTDSDKVARDYSIERVIRHPEYKPPSKYNDIALLETSESIVLRNKHISPACLDVGDDDTESAAGNASATGWGEYDDWLNADILQIMDLVKFSDEECAAEFAPHRLLRTGLDADTQICYGHREIARDTCTGDSGGPLQVEYAAVSCMHKVIGVTSFGKACGKTGRPGVYTRVLPYVPWIEALVWGDEYVITS